MASTVKTSVTELPESRARVEAEVAAEEVERRVHETALALGRELKVPGFRKGRVPPPLVLQRIGRDTVLDEAVRSALGNWYIEAIDAAGVAPIGDPEVSVGDLPAEGESLTFSIEIGVVPSATLGTYEGLEVGRREPRVEDEAVEAELKRLQERLARLETAKRGAQLGDFVVIDYAGSIDGERFPGGTSRDQLVELGSGRLISGFEEQLVGGGAGEERTVQITFPEDYGARQLAGQSATFEVAIKEVKSKELPDLDDDMASDAAGFDTMEELRADIVQRLHEADELEVENEFREAAVDAVVEQAQIDVPDALIESRAGELWQRLLASVARQGITKEAYLSLSGRDEAEILAEARPDAEQALRREAVLAAIVEAQAIEPSEGELLAALEDSAEQEKSTPQKLLEDLPSRGRLRDDLATRKAVDLVAERSVPIPVARVEAPEKLLAPDTEAAPDTPAEEDEAAAPGKIWTPGS